MPRGRITDSSTGLPLSGIVVANGEHVVLTDADGRYDLPPGRWVAVTVPAGWHAAGPWFVLPAADADFALARDPATAGDEVTFVHVADLHIGSYPASWFADDLAAIAAGTGREPGDPAPSFVAAVGDVTQGGKPEEFAAYLAAAETSLIPVVHVPGNHDWADRTGETWMRLVGPLWFSFDAGPAHVVVYDSTARLRDPMAPVDPWCAADLARVPADRPVVFLIHHQENDAFYANLRGEARIACTLSGHWHSSRVWVDGAGTLQVNHPTACMGGIDYSARGYTLVTVRADGSVQLRRRLLGTSHRARRTGIASVPEPPDFSSDPDAPDVRLGAPWPQFHGNALRDGRAAEPLHPPFRRRWRTRLPGGLLFGSPVIAGDTVAIAALDEETPGGGSVVALDARTGAVRWTHPTPESVKHTPAFAGDLVIAVTVAGTVLALDRLTGARRWTYVLGDPSDRWIYSAPLVVDRSGGGQTVVTGASRHFVALDAASGERVWLRDDLRRNDWISSYSSPASDGARVYIGFFWHPEPAWALDLATGETAWVVESANKDAGPAATPVLDGQGAIHITCHDSALRTYGTADGALRWELPLGQNPKIRHGVRWSAGSPALADGILYLPTGNGAIRAIGASDGARAWEWESDPSLAGVQAYARDGRSVLSSPLVAGDILIAGTSDGRIVALDRATGALAWSDFLDAPIVSSPAASGNLLACGASDGWLYAWTGE